ncbi:hypothetical protein [Ralstonia phage RSP15]|uniref:hypothetical protein n=1 Tax=Ralstonia phage RSP15 TaxID=1785960 RepID=UPI00074D3F52|nr:hypothetical protein BH754_gp207 [Ralstonia phage RSP15]BAU40099.1 hypothetical protein [Ralstonia phage RSP15]
MSTKLARKAIALFNNPDMPKATRRNYQRQWISSVSSLGKKWILSTPVKKIKEDKPVAKKAPTRKKKAVRAKVAHPA